MSHQIALYHSKTLQNVFPLRMVGSFPFGHSGRAGTLSPHVTHFDLAMSGAATLELSSAVGRALPKTSKDATMTREASIMIARALCNTI